MRPIFGPSGVSIGQIRPSWVGCTSRTSKPARSRVRPPGPSAETRRLWVTSDSGLFWSMNCDSCEEPKNSFTAAATGLALISSCGVSWSASAIVRRSRTARSTRTRPTRNTFSAISPTERTRRLPRWSMSSTTPRPLRISVSTRMTSRMSEPCPHRSRRRADSSSLRSAKYLASYSTDAAVELHPAHGREVVALEGEEQVVEQVLRGVLGRRLARTHHAVDLDQRLELGLGRIDAQGVGQVRAAVEVVDPQRADHVDAGLAQRGEVVFRDLLVGSGEQLTGIRVDDVMRKDAADEVFVRHRQGGDAGLLQLLHVARGDALAGLDDHLVAVGQVEVQRLAAQALGHELELHAFRQ